MRTFTFQPSPSLDPSILSRKSTCAKVSYEAQDLSSTDNHNAVYSDAKLVAPAANDEHWKVMVDFVPQIAQVSRLKATLHVTRGELGKMLGSAELGAV